MTPSPFPSWRRNLLWGLAWGIYMGLGLCAIAIAIRALGGGRSLEKLGITLLDACIAYLQAGVIGGLISGLSRPLHRWRLGSILIGWLIGTIFYGAIIVAVEGFPTQWDGSIWFAAVFLGLLLGGWSGNAYWESTVRPLLPRPTPSSLPPPRRRFRSWRH